MKKTITITIVFLLLTTIINILPNISTQTPPPPVGDWDIFDTTVISDSVIVLNGNLTVHPGGSLTLNNVTLIMNCTYDGKFGIIVNGTLEIINGSNITANNSSYEFFFGVGNDANFIMTESELHECGYPGGGGRDAGLLIQANDTLVKNNILSNNFLAITYFSNNNIIENNTIISNYNGIWVDSSFNITLINNTISFNTVTGIWVVNSFNITLINNTVNSHLVGIDLDSSHHNILIGNTANSNGRGITLGDGSDNNILIGNTANSNGGEGFIILVSSNNTLINNTANFNNRAIDLAGARNITITNFTANSNNNIGLYIRGGSANITMMDIIINGTKGTSIFLGNVNDVTMINSTISNSSQYDFYLTSDSHATLLNTSFNESKVFFNDMDSSLTTQWFLHINTTDYLGKPVSNANVRVMDNENGSFNRTFITDPDGYSRWIVITEFWQNQTHKVYYSPHKIMAWNNTLVGYAQPFINESKTVDIVLGDGTSVNLEPGWNLISLPRIQSDASLQSVLQSIEGHYDAVQWYNATDNSDQWKHYHISKPSNWNDLKDINHTMGLWVHVTDPGGTTLVVFGDVLTSTQNIALYPGWNLVGYPSTTDKIRTSALNNIFFDTEVNAIWTYNATMQEWKEITASDYFEVGRGYWIHSKVTKTWIVPL